ncbi:MAG: HAD family phosphatase [Patescibacteria group bacterium]|jgi:putative hydrolase of the HAD superfamily
MKIKTIIFDVGGVLVEKIFNPILNELANRYDLDYAVLKEYSWSLFDKVMLGEMTEKELFKDIINKFNIPAEVALLEERSTHLNPIPEVWEFVKKLQYKYKLIILSNLGRDWVKLREEQFHISDWFDEVVWSCDVGINKPDRRIFNYIIDKFALDPEACVFIDDKQNNIDAAQSFGMKGIVYQNPPQLEQDLAALGIDVAS